MKILFIPFFFLFFTTGTYAATPEEENSIIGYFVDVGEYVGDFFSYAPTFIEQMFAYIIEYCVIIKLKLQLESIQFAYGVALSLMQNLSLDSLLNDAFSGLSSQQKGLMNQYGIFVGLTRIVEAMVTRFVLDFMGS